MRLYSISKIGQSRRQYIYNKKKSKPCVLLDYQTSSNWKAYLARSIAYPAEI